MLAVPLYVFMMASISSADASSPLTEICRRLIDLEEGVSEPTPDEVTECVTSLSPYLEPRMAIVEELRGCVDDAKSEEQLLSCFIDSVTLKDGTIVTGFIAPQTLKELSNNDLALVALRYSNAAVHDIRWWDCKIMAIQDLTTHEWQRFPCEDVVDVGGAVRLLLAKGPCSTHSPRGGPSSSSIRCVVRARSSSAAYRRLIVINQSAL